MSRTKQLKYDNLHTLPNVLDLGLVFDDIEDVATKRQQCDLLLRSYSKPVIMELGCGGGDYTISLAQNHSDNFYLGIDIKGDRLYKGAKQAISLHLDNVGFIRTQIENLNSLLLPKSIQSIWITFPDPQPNNPKKRLTSLKYIDIYRQILKPDGILYLKTDSQDLYRYTLQILSKLKVDIAVQSDDLYKQISVLDATKYQTHYEQKYLKEGRKIYFIQWRFV